MILARLLAVMTIEDLVEEAEGVVSVTLVQIRRQKAVGGPGKEGRVSLGQNHLKRLEAVEK